MKLSSFNFDIADLVLLLTQTRMKRLAHAITLKLGVWALWCQRHVLNVYNSVKHAIANVVGRKDSEDGGKRAAGAESVGLERDLRALENMSVAIAALVARMRASYSL